MKLCYLGIFQRKRTDCKVNFDSRVSESQQCSAGLFIFAEIGPFNLQRGKIFKTYILEINIFLCMFKMTLVKIRLKIAVMCFVQGLLPTGSNIQRFKHFFYSPWFA